MIMAADEDSRLPDGLYRVGRRIWFCIRQGVLYLLVEMLHPNVVLACGRPLWRETDCSGTERVFMRAADLMAEAPSLADDMVMIATHYGCDL